MNQVRAGTVAHELNNVLAVIQGHVEILLDDVAQTSPLRGDLEAIHRSVARASSLVRQLPAANGHGE